VLWLLQMVNHVDLKVAVLPAFAAVNGDTVVILMITVDLIVKAELALEKHHLLQDQAQCVAERIGPTPKTTAMLLALEPMPAVLPVNRVSRI